MFVGEHLNSVFTFPLSYPAIDRKLTYKYDFILKGSPPCFSIRKNTNKINSWWVRLWREAPYDPQGMSMSPLEAWERRLSTLSPSHPDPALLLLSTFSLLSSSGSSDLCLRRRPGSLWDGIWKLEKEPPPDGLFSRTMGGRSGDRTTNIYFNIYGTEGTMSSKKTRVVCS